MKINRENISAILSKVQPAISSKDAIPVLACLCFSAESVHAFDGVVCLRFPAKLGITGGVRGELLIGFLNAAKSTEIDVTQDGEKILIKSGRSKLDTTLIPEAEFLFEAPDLTGATSIPVDTEFLAGLNKAALSMGRDASHTWRYGITVVPTVGKSFVGYKLLATDDKTIARASIPKEVEEGEAILLPPRFVDLLLTIAKDDAPKKMLIAEKWGEVRFMSGLKLFTKTVTGADPTKYDSVFEQIGDKVKSVAVAIPDGMDTALGRSMLVVKHSREPHVRLIADGERLKFETKSDAGDIRDNLACDHAAIDVYAAPDLILKGLPYANKMAIVDECVCMTAKGFTFLVCTSNTAQPKEEVAAGGTEND